MLYGKSIANFAEKHTTEELATEMLKGLYGVMRFAQKSAGDNLQYTASKNIEKVIVDLDLEHYGNGATPSAGVDVSKMTKLRFTYKKGINADYKAFVLAWVRKAGLVVSTDGDVTVAAFSTRETVDMVLAKNTQLVDVVIDRVSPNGK